MDTSKSFDYENNRVVNEEWRSRASPQPQEESPAFPPSVSQYKFSPDELRVLRECNKESFFQRSMPLGIGLGLATYVGIRRGFLKPSARFGPFPKMTLAAIVGYFIGKVSYQETCAEKLMALPGSYIGQLLRDRKDGKMSNSPKSQTPTSMFGAKPEDIYSDAGPGNSLDLDTDRPLFSDDTYHPDTSLVPSVQDVSPAQPTLSYDDLRRRNRGEYTDARQNPYKMEPRMASPPPQRPPPPSAQSTNKYGDVID